MSARDVLELLVPSRCLGCRARAALPWCARCAAVVRPLGAGCERCAGARTAGHACWPTGAPIATTTAVFDYRGPVAAAVVTAKLAGARRGWRPLGRLLAERVATCPPELDAVTWVATAAARRRARGVDHARLLAAEVADRLEVPLLDTLHARAPRHGPDRFTARLRLPGSDLLLVDDVLTTGATASRVAGVLRDAGAGRIHLAVLARAGSHALVDVGATVPPGAPGPDGGVRRVLGPR